jgi:hypothetical protein
MMPHIISDDQYREFQAFKATGLTPKQIRSLVPEDAPLPLDLYENQEEKLGE